jgi:hypothetical protein
MDSLAGTIGYFDGDGQAFTGQILLLIQFHLDGYLGRAGENPAGKHPKH